MTTLAENMRTWRARDLTPVHIPPMSPEMAALLGCDTPEGFAGYARLSTWRAAGYRGPLDQHGEIPDPDDPANADMIAVFERLAAQ